MVEKKNIKWDLLNAASAFATTLTIGTLIGHYVEGWSWLDAFYYVGMTMTTVGYGDIVPTKPITKILAVFLGTIGITIVLYSAMVLGSAYFQRRERFLKSGMERIFGWKQARTNTRSKNGKRRKAQVFKAKNT